MKRIALILAAALALGLCGCGNAAQVPSSRTEPSAPSETYSTAPPSGEPEEPNEEPAVEPDAPDVESALEPSAPVEEPAIEEEPLDEKPAIYLYPETPTEVTVKLDYAGTVTCTYPEYGKGWHILAEPDGVLTDGSGRQYNCLFWEGVSDVSYDFRRGFCVAGADTRAFLEEKLAQMGLSDRETGDFIAYWLPRMQDHPYNLIAFQGRAYTDAAALTVEPQPDTMIRVFMAFRPLEEPVDIPEQELPGVERKGFTAVEWGGAEVRKD